MFRNTVTVLLFAAFSAGVFASESYLEVEDFDGPWRKQTNITGFQGTGFCTSNATGIAKTSMTGQAEIAEAGTYAVWARGYTSENSNRAFAIQVGETVFDPTHGGSVRAWSWARVGEIALAAGTVPVVVHDAADGFESVDAILLTNDLDADPEAALAAQRRWLVYPEGLPEVADPLRFNIEASRQALARRTDPASAADWAERAPGIKAALRQGLGLAPWPEKTPLNARITGRADRGFYTVENLVFESRPDFYVTANLYLPKDTVFPAPAVVVVPGHAMEEGKNYPLYQLGQLGMVKEGIVVLAYDPIGQGERKLPGFKHELGYGSLLVGQTNEGYIVWDTIRAIDYLVTREEVDPKRLGLAGNSGGGENVFYTMPLDGRIQAGTSFSFVCSYDLWIAEGGNHCICNHLPGIVGEMEEFEIIGLNAPRPFLAGNGSEDKIFPIAGHRETIRRAGEIYALSDSANRVKSVEAPLGHGWSQPLREAGWGWMNQWLLGKGEGAPVPEEGLEAEDPKSPDLRCLKDGAMPEGAETVVTLNRKRVGEFVAGYSTPPATQAEWEARAPLWREDVWAVLGGRPAAFNPTARTVNAFEQDGLQIEVLAIAVESGMEVGAVFARPAVQVGARPATVFAGGHADKRLAVLSGYAAEAAKEGPVLVLDPRGTGESFQHENHLTSDTILLGRPLFAQQVWDLLQAGRYLAGRPDVEGGSVRVHGVKNGALLALYAAALDPVFSKVEAKDVLASYRYFLEDEQPQSISLCVPNILKVADIPQIVALAAPTPVAMEGVVGFAEAGLAPDAAREALAFSRAIYGIAGAAGRLRIE